MVVNFTTNIGLAKPTEAELAEDWVSGPKLAEDNNLIVIDKTDVNLTTYTPVFAAQTTAPSVGSGILRGEFQDIQGFIFGAFVVEFLDPGVTVGSGEYGIRLPAVADNVYHSVGTAFNALPGTFSVIGEGYLFDNSNLNTSGTCALDVVTVAGSSYARLITETHAAKTSRIFTNAMPFSVGTLDTFAGSFCYKKL